MVPMPDRPVMAALALAPVRLLQPNDRQSLADGATRGQPWTKTLIIDESLLEGRTPESGLIISLPSMKYRHRSGSSEGGCLSPGITSHPMDVHQGLGFTEGRQIPGTPYFSFPLIFTKAPRKFFWLVVLASIVIPITSAETPIPYVDVAVWAFGILANVPSIYVLANPYLSSSGEGRTEDTIWKVARTWSVSFGPVFALVLVMILRAKLPREKRKAFIVLLFVVSTLGIIILMLFTRDEKSWSVLDMLSICVSWCGAICYLIVDELRIITASVTSRSEQIELSQISHTGPHESEEDDQSRLEAGRASHQSDGVFTIGDDSTLGDRGSRADS